MYERETCSVQIASNLIFFIRHTLIRISEITEGRSERKWERKREKIHRGTETDTIFLWMKNSQHKNDIDIVCQWASVIWQTYLKLQLNDFCFIFVQICFFSFRWVCVSVSGYSIHCPTNFLVICISISIFFSLSFSIELFLISHAYGMSCIMNICIFSIISTR